MPSVQRRKVWLTPYTRVPCSNAAKTQNQLKFGGVLQTTETISTASGLNFTILRGHAGEILLLKEFFFRLSICALAANIYPEKVVRWCADNEFLWSPYVIGQTIIFLPCDFYLSFFFFLLFFPRLISAVGDWMSTILLHMAWP